MHDLNKVAMTDILKITVVGAILLTAALPSLSYGGHFTLAYQRKLPSWENNAGIDCPPEALGGRATRVWIWDENGNPVSNIQLKTTWDVLMGATDTDGRCEIAYNPGIAFDLVCVDGQGSTSDIAYMMTAELEPCRPRHSYEVGYLYKTDISNPGTFDTDLLGTWPEMDGYCEEAPYTKSLAYSGVDFTDYWSDRSHWGNWQTPPSYFGQTFVATGDRVVAARVQGTLGGLDLLDWELRIVTFPGLVPVGQTTSVPFRWPFGWEAFWGVDDCPVVPGQTYMLQVWRDGGGMNIYHVTQDVYPQGQYYEGTTAIPGYDLNGHICCMSYGPQGPDLNRDSKVNFKDVSILAQYFDGDEPSVDIGPPPLGDGKINYKDLAVIVADWLIATTIPPLPGPASNLAPANGATNVDPNADLSWTAGTDAESHDVYFGIFNPPPFIRNQTAVTFDPGTMPYSTTYYWRIDERNAWGKTEGIVWSFKTRAPPKPPGLCFPGDTPVWVNGALEQISRVSARQEVGKLESAGLTVCLKQIESVKEYDGSYVCHDIVLETGNRITVVDSHRFLVDSGQWVPVQNLRNGTRLVSLKGTIGIKSIVKRHMPFVGKVYNLKIKGGDRYFVGKDGVAVRDY